MARFKRVQTVQHLLAAVRIYFGRKSVSLRDVVDRDEARNWIVERLRSKGAVESAAA